MSLSIFTHESGLEHNTGPGHPEAPIRQKVLMDAINRAAGERWSIVEAPQATDGAIKAVHQESYVEAVKAAVPASGRAPLDPDTWISPRSEEAARRACGAAVAAVDAVIAKEMGAGFVAMRPPGHHATPDRAMGFCLYNQIAVAAAHALAEHALERVAVFDFDVHHGNGTQDIFWHRAEVMYLSIHQMPLFPGTGAASERGVGNIVNSPFAPNTPAATWRAQIERDMLPALADYEPQFLFVSAGFDAHVSDPLANGMLEAEDFSWVTDRLVEVAGEVGARGIVSVLEGGYNPSALAESAIAHLERLPTRAASFDERTR
ncbi:MAG: histone deacetylase family protein [Geminicoccaceae bacterium]